MKTANDLQIGDVIVQRTYDGEDRVVTVTDAYVDINGRPGFDGTLENGVAAWGYCEQIVRYISHATPQTFADYIDSIKPFTVADMKKALEGLPDNTQILFSVPAGTNLNSDWFNVDRDYIRPDLDPDYSALTFSIKDNYDSRQF